MLRALDETERRRAKQRAYNQAHGITPRGIQKAVADSMEGAYAHPGAPLSATQYARVAEETAAYAREAPALLMMKKIKQLEQAMVRHARDLEFEEAAKLRDEIQRIRQFGLGLPETKAG